MSEEFVKIILCKSIIGRLPRHRSTVIGLGLKKINDHVIVKRSAIIDGMINKVRYLFKIEVIK